MNKSEREAARQLLQKCDRVQDALVAYSIELVDAGSKTTAAGVALRNRLRDMSACADDLRDLLYPKTLNNSPHGAEVTQ